MSDYAYEAFGAEAKAIADHENEMNEIHERLLRKVKALQNIYNRNNCGYAFLRDAKQELAEFEASI